LSYYLADNEPNEKTAKYTGLTVEQIEQLRNEKTKITVPNIVFMKKGQKCVI
jgi:hypothetical protein